MKVWIVFEPRSAAYGEDRIIGVFNNRDLAYREANYRTVQLRKGWHSVKECEVRDTPILAHTGEHGHD